MNFKAITGRLLKFAKARSKDVGKKIQLAEDQVVIPSEIRRSEKGRRIIRDALLKAAALDHLHFAKESCFRRSLRYVLGEELWRSSFQGIHREVSPLLPVQIFRDAQA